MAEVDPEVERIAELCWRAFDHRETALEKWPRGSMTPHRWRAIACAVIADRAAQPTTPLYVVFDGPPSHESGRFVELETEDGRSVGPAESGAEWREQGGLWYLGPLFPNPEPARQAERAEPPVTNGPTLMQIVAERDDARRESDDIRQQLCNLLAVIHRDGGHHTGAVGLDSSVSDARSAVLSDRSHLDESNREIEALERALDDQRQRREMAEACARDALARCSAPSDPPAEPLSQADILDGAEEMLRRIAASSLLGLDATEAAAIVAELDRLRAAKGNP